MKIFVEAQRKRDQKEASKAQRTAGKSKRKRTSAKTSKRNLLVVEEAEDAESEIDATGLSSHCSVLHF
jgi:hypothetical protein